MATLQNTLVVETSIEPNILEQAFERFTEASKRLETRYEALLKETENLREQVREKDIAIKRAEKLSLLGETAAGIAHEIRNPLGAMRLFVSLLQRDLVGKPDSLVLLEHIDRSISTLDHVVSNILQFSKKTPSVCSPVNVHAVINEQVEHFRLNAKSSVMHVTLNGAAFVSANEHSLRQVFFNLLMNAQQATRYEGQIWIEAEASDTALQVRIRDDGPGVPTDIMPKMFEPFTTTKNEGTGLGLAIVKQILDEHGAAVSVRNAPGAEFTISFPRGSRK